MCIRDRDDIDDVFECLNNSQKRRDALRVRESQLSKQVEDLQKDCLRNLADRQNEVKHLLNLVIIVPN